MSNLQTKLPTDFDADDFEPIQEWSDEELEREMEALAEQLEAFAETPHFRKLKPEYSELVVPISTYFGEAMFTYHGQRFTDWTEAALEQTVLYILPGKVVVDDIFFEALAPIVAAFNDYLAENSLNPNAKELSNKIKSLALQIIHNAADENYWSMTKTMAMSAIESGVDINDEEAFAAFAQQYNQAIKEMLWNLDENKLREILNAADKDIDEEKLRMFFKVNEDEIDEVKTSGGLVDLNGKPLKS
jgi:hypothetical protein